MPDHGMFGPGPTVTDALLAIWPPIASCLRTDFQSLRITNSRMGSPQDAAILRTVLLPLRRIDCQCFPPAMALMPITLGYSHSIITSRQSLQQSGIIRYWQCSYIKAIRLAPPSAG